MVKGGTKRKIDIKKITNKSSKATTFTKRLNGLYSKASQLCMITGAQIAILSTPSSSHSNVPFYSFGHSSVDDVVSAFLSGQSLLPVSEESKEMREDFGICLARIDLGLGHWWDDERLEKNPGEINDAIESIKSLLNHVKRLRTEEVLLDETLITDVDDLPGNFSDEIVSVSDNKNKALSPSANLDEWSDMDLDQLIKGFNDDIPVNFNAEHDKILSVSDNNKALSPAGNLDEWSDMDLDQLLKGFDDCLPEKINEKTEQAEHNKIFDDDLPANFNAKHDKILSVSNNNNALSSAGNLDEWSDMHLDQLLKGFDDDLPANFNAEHDNISDDDLPGNFNAEHDEILSVSDNNNAFLPAGNLEEWNDMDLDQLLKGFDDDLPEILDEKTEQEDHQIVAVTENCCNNKKKTLLPAGKFDDEQELLDLDFESICEGLEDLDCLIGGY